MATIFSMSSNLILEGIHTTVPTNATNPIISFKLVPNLKNFSQETFNKYGHILLFYSKLGSDESGWFHSGWFKDTLGRALFEQPILGGRLRRLDHGFDVMANDGGIRMIEVQAQVDLEEYLELKTSETRFDLLHFKEVDEEDLHFSPLLYIQVTSFKCGGYSLGITYNLLLSDPFLMENFLQKWAEIHKNVLFTSDIPKMPLFYLPNIKRMGNPPQLLELKTSKDMSTNVVMFEVAIDGAPSYEVCNSIALKCVEEAESKTGTEMTVKFMLLVKEVSSDLRVDVTSKPSLVSFVGESKYSMKGLGWDDLETKNVAFWKGNAPTLLSHYVGSLGQDGLVFLVISARDEGKVGMKVLVAFPN